MRSLIAWTAAIWMSLGQSGVAGDPVVIELFTSQGCSSCPPADALLARIADRDDVIALALHVDYWDYIGWKDHFADPAHAKRQRAYARANGKRMVYTPQMIVGGVEQLVGSRPMDLMDAIDAHRAAPYPATVTLQRDGDRVRVRVSAETMPSDAAVIYLATYTPQETVDIGRGENAGRRFTYHNIVRNFVTIGEWDGRGVYTAAARVPRGMPVAVLVQARGNGPVLGAAKVD